MISALEASIHIHGMDRISPASDRGYGGLQPGLEGQGKGCDRRGRRTDCTDCIVIEVKEAG